MEHGLPDLDPKRQRRGGSSRAERDLCGEGPPRRREALPDNGSRPQPWLCAASRRGSDVLDWAGHHKAVVALPRDEDPVDVDDAERRPGAVDRDANGLAREEPPRKTRLGQGPRAGQRGGRAQGRERGWESDDAPRCLGGGGTCGRGERTGRCDERCPPNPYCGRIVIARLVRSLHDWIIFTCPVELPPAKFTSASSSSFSSSVTW